MKSKRRFMRLSAPVGIPYQTLDGIPTRFRHHVIDISREGLRLSGRHELPPGAYMELRLRLPNIERLIVVFGQVVWSKKINAEYQSGVLITKIGTADRDLLLDHAYNATLKSRQGKKL